MILLECSGYTICSESCQLFWLVSQFEVCRRENCEKETKIGWRGKLLRRQQCLFAGCQPGPLPGNSRIGGPVKGARVATLDCTRPYSISEMSKWRNKNAKPLCENCSKDCCRSYAYLFPISSISSWVLVLQPIKLQRSNQLLLNSAKNNR